MRRRCQTGILLCAVLCLAAGCVTRSHTPGSDLETRELRIKAGDEIRMVTTRRERISLQVTEVQADRFVGMTLKPHPKELRPQGQAVEVRFDELALLEITRFEKKTLAVAAMAAIVTVTAGAAVLGSVGVMALPPGP